MPARRGGNFESSRSDGEHATYDMLLHRRKLLQKNIEVQPVTAGDGKGQNCHVPVLCVEASGFGWGRFITQQDVNFVRIGNTQKIITTHGMNKAGMLIGVRKC